MRVLNHRLMLYSFHRNSLLVILLHLLLLWELILARQMNIQKIPLKPKVSL